MKLDFVRGHMGGNTIVLLDGTRLPRERELELATAVLGPHYLAAHEAGVLYPAAGKADLAVKIAEPTSNCFISACGGMTQVLGKALVETELGRRFGIEIKEPVTTVVLETGAGPTELNITVKGARAERVITDMTAFARECYQRGVGMMEICGVPVGRAGKFLVVNGDAVRRVYPRADFKGWDEKTRRLLTEIQHEFIERTGESEYNFCLYDWHPEHEGDLRVVFPHHIPQGYFEPSCGTGSVALGIALLEAGELQRHRSFAGTSEEAGMELRLESGGSIELGGPDLTRLFMKIEEGRVSAVSFTHSFVQVTAVGEVRF